MKNTRAQVKVNGVGLVITRAGNIRPLSKVTADTKRKMISELHIKAQTTSTRTKEDINTGAAQDITLSVCPSLTVH